MFSDSPNVFTKDPHAILDYTIDWGTNWLGVDTIDTVSWTVPTGIVKVSQSNTDQRATVFLASGTAGQSYDVICRIVTDGGRQDERTITIMVRNK